MMDKAIRKATTLAHKAAYADVAELYAELNPGLLRYLTVLTGQGELAQDLAQETWIRAITRGSQYRGEVPYDFWLRAIARNLYIDGTRRSRRRRQRSIEPENECDIEVIVQDRTPSPFDLAVTSEVNSRISHVVANLDQRSQQLIVEKFFEELALREIAARHGMKISTVKSAIYRGLRSMRNPMLRFRSRSPIGLLSTSK